MENKNYIKVFASLGIYLGIIPSSLIDVKNLKEAEVSDKSNGSSNHLLSNYFKDIDVSTLYLMQHIDTGCQANCAFCVQSQGSTLKRKHSYLVDKEMIRLPVKILKNFLAANTKARSEIKRICIQTVYNSDTVPNLIQLAEDIREVCQIPITACCIPVSKEALLKIKKAGIDHITINYETATEKLFDKIRGIDRKGPYRWEAVTSALNNAMEIFGQMNVGSHLQIGLGETQREALSFVDNLNSKHIRVSLFAFTPVSGTAMSHYKRVNHSYFHKVQLGSYLIKNNIVPFNRMKFSSDGTITGYGLEKDRLDEIILSGKPFRNAGCPGCNRIYYETNPGERMYSYPRELTIREKELIYSEIRGV